MFLSSLNVSPSVRCTTVKVVLMIVLVSPRAPSAPNQRRCCLRLLRDPNRISGNSPQTQSQIGQECLVLKQSICNFQMHLVVSSTTPRVNHCWMAMLEARIGGLLLD